MGISNSTGIPLGLAVWVVHDDYDYIDKPNYISVTSLMKPLRHIVLPKRIPVNQRESDVKDFVASALGKSIHDSIEKAWTQGYKKNLKKLGYPDSVINRVLINPEKHQLEIDSIPVYIEQRAFKDIDGYTIGGKYDIIADGMLQDNKSTTAFSWLYGTKDDDYALQGSIYRWLNQDKVTEDFIRINFIFTDWKKADAASNPKYPQERLLFKDIPLWSIEKTEAWIKNKLTQVAHYIDSVEADIPECTEEELWRSENVYKYFSDPTKTTGRSTKNFTSLAEANRFLTAEKGGKGVVITVAGTVKRCEYCDAAPICTQREKYFHA